MAGPTVKEVPAHWPRISDFYAGKSVFITGATGFIGKALIWKLLYSCPNIREIFVLTRAKKGFTVEQRLKQILNSKAFLNIRERNAALLDKVVPVTGDITEEGLGLNAVERQTLIERVSVIFHVAANVKFDDTLKHAIFVNVRATRDVCILAASMKNLVSLLHVSSTYTQTDKAVVNETYYEPGIDWRKAIKQAETMDEKLLDTITMKYIHPMPNTYTFTKRIAEKVVHDYSKDVPCIVLRPSIVVAALAEPFPGWVDNFNGPVGLMLGGGKGLLRVVYIDGNINADFIPVDVAVKMMITAAYHRGMVTITQDPSMHVYNCASANMHKIRQEELITLGLKQHQHVPLDNIIWYPQVTLTTCFVYYYILVLLLHILPSLVIDRILKFYGHTKLSILKLQRKIYASNMTLAYFITNTWFFKNERSLSLLRSLLENDREDFGLDLSHFDRYEYFRHSIIGAKQCLFNEDLANIEKSKKHLTRLYWIRAAKNVLLIAAFTLFLLQFETFPYITALIGGICLLPFMKH